MDDDARHVAGSASPADVLASDPLFRLFRGSLAHPIAAGCAIAILVLLLIVFGAAGTSRFIYTDF